MVGRYKELEKWMWEVSGIVLAREGRRASFLRDEIPWAGWFGLLYTPDEAVAQAYKEGYLPYEKGVVEIPPE